MRPDAPHQARPGRGLAFRGVGRTTAPFETSGPLTEAVLLGTVAARFSGQRLAWDAPGLRISNHTAADGFVRKGYRDGWKI